MSRTIHGNPYLSKPIGSHKPPRLARPVIAEKKVSISNQDPRHEDPNWHYAAAAGIFVRVADLYDNRKKR